MRMVLLQHVGYNDLSSHTVLAYIVLQLKAFLEIVPRHQATELGSDQDLG